MDAQNTKKIVLAHSRMYFVFGVALFAFRITAAIFIPSPLLANYGDFAMSLFCLLTWIFSKIALNRMSLASASRYSLFTTANLVIWICGGGLSLFGQIVVYIPLIPKLYYIIIYLLSWFTIFVLGLIKFIKYRRFSKVFVRVLTISNYQIFGCSPNGDILETNPYAQSNTIYTPPGAPAYSGQPYQNTSPTLTYPNANPYYTSPKYNFTPPPPLPSESTS